jgi:hypothetical protein
VNSASPPTLEYLFSYTATLQAPEIVGPVPEGIRVNFYVTGGGIAGPRLNGRVRPVGGDWLTIRRDGMGVLDVRITLETADGAVIDAAYRGLGDLGPDGYEKFLRGELPPALPLRTSPVMRTAHPAYQWLQRELMVGLGVADFVKSEARYDVYAVR